MKIRTEIDFFQSRAKVSNSVDGLGMTVVFHEVSPALLARFAGLDIGGMHKPRD